MLVKDFIHFIVIIIIIIIIVLTIRHDKILSSRILSYPVDWSYIETFLKHLRPMDSTIYLPITTGLLLLNE